MLVRRPLGAESMRIFFIFTKVIANIERVGHLYE